MSTTAAEIDAGPADGGSARNEPTLSTAVRVGGFVLITLAVSALVFALARPVQVLPLMQPAPAMSLRDSSGATVKTARLAGTVVVLQLSTLECSGSCADGHAALQRLQRRLQTSRPRVPVWLLTVLLDGSARPAAVLRERQTALAADPRWWRVVTADRGGLKAAIGAGLGVYYATDPSGRVAFEPATFLVDERGIVRASYRTASPDPGRIARDLDLVLREASSRGAVRAAYAAAHLFLCYPR